ncbi:hypothetical protein IKF12_02840 [Candidatus Saccharibacteria bacterium]|nr:hypothetical protein [Candidatus Saccharibacteria bacterium]
MSGVKDKLRQLKYKVKHDYLAIENIVLVVAVIMCLTWTFQSIEAMSRNWTLTERLNTERKNLELLKIEVETAELENEYLKSDEYQELAARKHANKMLPGENMVALPENSESAKNKHQKTEVATTSDETKDYSNPEKWLRFLFPSY